MSKTAVIIIGASGGLGTALCKQWQQSSETDYVFAVSRTQPSMESSSENIQFIVCDYSEDSIIQSCEVIKTQMENLQLESITRVCICNGIVTQRGNTTGEKT